MNQNRLAWLLLIVLVVPLVGCGTIGRVAPREEYYLEGVAETGVAMEAPAMEPSVKSGERAGVPAIVDVDRKIIYTVSLDLIVKDTESAFEKARQLAQDMGGFVAESNVWRDEGYPVASLTVRVPVGKLEDALTQLRALAVDVESENMGSQDVTEEYVDLAARLSNEQRTEAELLELLESRSQTGKTADILEVHRELSAVRSQIEQIQGRIKYLENLSAMATIRISLTPDVLVQPIVVGGWQPQGTARDAVRMLLKTLQVLAQILIWFVIYILPVLLILGIAVWILVLIVRAIWRWTKKRRGRRAA